MDLRRRILYSYSQTRRESVKPIVRFLAALALGTCLFVAVQRFTGGLSDEDYKTTFAVASLAWFIFAPMSFTRNQ